VELIYPKNTGPALVDKYTSDVICVIFDVNPDILAIGPYVNTAYVTHLLYNDIEKL
jgi:hypothetical protein